MLNCACLIGLRAGRGDGLAGHDRLVGARDQTSRPLASALLRRYGWWVFDKLQVVDIWESQQDFGRFGETLIVDPSEIGLDPGQSVVEPVHNLIPG